MMVELQDGGTTALGGQRGNGTRIVTKARRHPDTHHVCKRRTAICICQDVKAMETVMPRASQPARPLKGHTSSNLSSQTARSLQGDMAY